MIPLRWKIFRIVNWIQLIFFLVMIAFFLLQFLRISGQEYGGFLLFIFFLLIPAGISLLNVQLVNRFFPDRTLTKSYSRLLTASIITGCIYLGGLLIILIFLGIEFFSGSVEVGTYERFLYTTVVGAFGLGAYNLGTEIGIETFLNRNAYRSMKELIQDIGSEEEQKP